MWVLIMKNISKKYKKQESIISDKELYDLSEKNSTEKKRMMYFILNNQDIVN